MHDGQAYGQGLAEVVRDQFTALGGEVVDFDAITPGESDYTAPLADDCLQGPRGSLLWRLCCRRLLWSSTR